MSCYEKLCLSSASPAVNEEEIRGSKCRDSRPRGHKHRQEDLRQPRSMLSREFARECVGERFRECVTGEFGGKAGEEGKSGAKERGSGE